jgi:cellulose biosynthesis protein BcsQ
MLNSIIIGADTDPGRYVRQMCGEFPDICIYKVLPTTARLHEVILSLNAYGPEVVFLDVFDLNSEASFSASCLQEILVKHPLTAIVPFCSAPRVLSSPDLTALGPLLIPPFSAEQLELAVREALRLRRPGLKTAKTITFLPAKPGAGATTLAVHAAWAASVVHGKKTLLIEADSESGPISYMLNVQLANPAGEAVENHLMTDSQWSRNVDCSYGFDILPAGGGQYRSRGSRWDYYRLLKFARERYEVVIVDLPEQLNDVSESMIRESDKVVMVCTPEIASLCMVRRRLHELEEAGIPYRHMRLVANQHAADDPGPAAMEKIARCPVTSILPEDFLSIKNATRRRGLVAANCEFSRCVVQVTTDLLELQYPQSSGFSLLSLKKAVGQVFGLSQADVSQPPAAYRVGSR